MPSRYRRRGIRTLSGRAICAFFGLAISPGWELATTNLVAQGVTNVAAELSDRVQLSKASTRAT
jgi:hypothetical protein